MTSIIESIEAYPEVFRKANGFGCDIQLNSNGNSVTISWISRMGAERSTIVNVKSIPNLIITLRGSTRIRQLQAEKAELLAQAYSLLIHRLAPVYASEVMR